MKIKLFDAGHTPGSAQVQVEADGKKILFTGDYNMEDSKMLKGATMDYGDYDAVITESTYASEDHTLRPELEKSFVEAATEIVELGGTVSGSSIRCWTRTGDCLRFSQLIILNSL